MEANTNYQMRIEEVMERVQKVDELEFEPIDRRYRAVQIILTALGYVLLAGAACFLLLIENRLWFILAECVIVAAMAFNLFILRKAWENKGYALREKDITYRSGIVFPKTITIPYEKLQQVTLKQNPVSKMYNLYAVEVVNGAQGMASLTIPGLTEERANQIKGIVIERLKNDEE